MNKPATSSTAQRPQVHDCLADLLARHFRRYRRRLKACQGEFSEKAVHDLRVSIRRLLSTVDLLGNFLSARRVKKARCALKDQLDAFDELRDIHVQLLRLAALPQTEHAVSSFRAFLFKREREEIGKARSSVKHLRSGRIAELIDEFEDELRRRRKSRIARKDFVGLLRQTNQAFDRVAELRAQIDPADTATIHRTRVAFKKFRYTVEALAPLLPEIAPPRLRAMRAYQNLMGSIQDATVLWRSARKFARKNLDAAASAPFQRELESQCRRLVRRYLKAADKLAEFGPLRVATRTPNPGSA